MEARNRLPVGRAILYVVLIFWAVFMIMPFAWMLLTSLKAQSEAMKVPIVWPLFAAMPPT